MIKNIHLTFNSFATEEQLIAFAIPQNKKMELILAAVQNMIQEYTGVLLSKCKVTFESDHLNEFPYYPIRNIQFTEQKNDMYYTTYECGVESNNYVAAALCIAKEIYITEELLSVDTIKKYTPWLPFKAKYI